MNELALFFGGGGSILASVLLGHRIVCGVEIDSYCREIALRRQEEKIIPPFPVWDDVKSFYGVPWRGLVDLITAGFPCQPFSVAGKRLQEKDNRNCWPDTMRVISEVQPVAVLLENVPGIRRYLSVVIRDLRRNGYVVEKPAIVAASEIGAKHERKRVWILAYAHNARLSQFVRPEEKYESGPGPDRFFVQDEWGVGNPSEAFIRGGFHGIPFRVDRIKALGNAWVPGVARKAWHVLCQRAATREANSAYNTPKAGSFAKGIE